MLHQLPLLYSVQLGRNIIKYFKKKIKRKPVRVCGNVESEQGEKLIRLCAVRVIDVEGIEAWWRYRAMTRIERNSFSLRQSVNYSLSLFSFASYFASKLLFFPLYVCVCVCAHVHMCMIWKAQETITPMLSVHLDWAMCLHTQTVLQKHLITHACVHAHSCSAVLFYSGCGFALMLSSFPALLKLFCFWTCLQT